MRARLYILQALFLGLFLFPTFSSAQRLLSTAVKADGNIYTVNIGGAQQNVFQVAAFFPVSGNITTAYEVYLEGPPGLKAEVKSLGLGSSSLEIAATSPDSWNLSKVFGLDRKEKPSFSLTESSDLSTLIQGNKKTNMYFHLQKDACSGGKTSSYGGMVLIDVTGVDPSRIFSGYTIQVGLKEYKFAGSMAGSLKPSSDGKYRGEPIILMSSIAHYGKEFINVVKWKNGKVTSTKRIPVVKYVQYKNANLSLGRVQGLLNGGKATFELSDGGYVYGACFTLARRRQTVNGYPL